MSAQERLDHPDNLLNHVEFKRLHKGGGKEIGQVSLPHELRVLIGTSVASGLMTTREAGDTFGASHTAAENYAKGTTGPQGFDEKLDRDVKAGSAKVREKALDRLGHLFEKVITEENLETLKPREAISAAKDLASVADRVQERIAEAPKVQFIVFQPRVKEEREYPSITVEATPSGS